MKFLGKEGWTWKDSDFWEKEAVWEGERGFPTKTSHAREQRLMAEIGKLQWREGRRGGTWLCVLLLFLWISFSRGNWTDCSGTMQIVLRGGGELRKRMLVEKNSAYCSSNILEWYQAKAKRTVHVMTASSVAFCGDDVKGKKNMNINLKVLIWWS